MSLPKFTPPEPENNQPREFLPLVTEEGLQFSSTVIDAALAKGLDQEGLMKLKAVEYTIQFLKGRQVTGQKTIEDTFNTFYKQISNGTEQN